MCIRDSSWGLPELQKLLSDPRAETAVGHMCLLFRGAGLRACVRGRERPAGPEAHPLGEFCAGSADARRPP
eukprot:5028172-Alexandrium_andersonii.AAC.1